MLERHGYQVQAGGAGLPTAFLGTRGQGSPRIGILVEYDALPEVDHKARKKKSLPISGRQTCVRPGRSALTV